MSDKRKVDEDGYEYWEDADDVPGTALSTCCGRYESDMYKGMCECCKEYCTWYDGGEV